MKKLIDEFRRGWQGISQPSTAFCVGFCAVCLLLSTSARWGLAQIRPDVFFTPYFPAVFFATAVCGLRFGLATALLGGVLGLVVNFSAATADAARLILLAIFWIVAALTIWGVAHYRGMVVQQRAVSRKLIQEEAYRRLVVEELQHRAKNKLSTIHAVLRQVLHNQPEVWSVIDHRLRALSATDDLILRADGSGCDIGDLLRSELGPYDHVRFTLNGEPLFLPAKLAVSLALIFHELATNAGKYGAFSSASGLLQVSWTRAEDRLAITWDETEGPPVQDVGAAGFGTRLLKSALMSFDGKTEIAYLKTGVHCTMQCRIPES
jgi:two-component sensor histidine kinase